MRPARRALAGVLLAVLAGELWSRRVASGHHAWDPELGEILAPGRPFVSWGEGSGWGAISAHGTRVSPRPAASARAAPGDDVAIPILVLGDSYAEALQVGDDELFSNRLALLLAADGLRVRVTNAGRSAYSMADYVCSARAFERLFAPRWVVIQVNASDFLVGPAYAPGPDRATFRQTTSGLACVAPALSVPAPQRAGLRQAAHDLRDALVLPDLLVARIHARIVQDDQISPLFSATRAPAPTTSSEAVQAPPVEEQMEMLREAWGPRLTLLYLAPFDPRAPLDVTPFERGLEAAAHAHGVRFCSLREAFPELVTRRRVPYGFANTRLNAGHWNRDGHEAAARILRRELLELRSNGLL